MTVIPPAGQAMDTELKDVEEGKIGTPTFADDDVTGEPPMRFGTGEVQGGLGWGYVG